MKFWPHFERIVPTLFLKVKGIFGREFAIKLLSIAKNFFAMPVYEDPSFEGFLRRTLHDLQPRHEKRNSWFNVKEVDVEEGGPRQGAATEGGGPGTMIVLDPTGQGLPVAVPAGRNPSGGGNSSGDMVSILKTNAKKQPKLYDPPKSPEILLPDDDRPGRIALSFSDSEIANQAEAAGLTSVERIDLVHRLNRRVVEAKSAGERAQLVRKEIARTVETRRSKFDRDFREVIKFGVLGEGRPREKSRLWLRQPAVSLPQNVRSDDWARQLGDMEEVRRSQLQTLGESRFVGKSHLATRVAEGLTRAVESLGGGGIFFMQDLTALGFWEMVEKMIQTWRQEGEGLPRFVELLGTVQTDDEMRRAMTTAMMLLPSGAVADQAVRMFYPWLHPQYFPNGANQRFVYGNLQEVLPTSLHRIMYGRVVPVAAALFMASYASQVVMGGGWSPHLSGPLMGTGMIVPISMTTHGAYAKGIRAYRRLRVARNVTRGVRMGRNVMTASGIGLGAGFALGALDFILIGGGFRVIEGYVAEKNRKGSAVRVGPPSSSL